jgi:hypothetical protein
MGSLGGSQRVISIFVGLDAKRIREQPILGDPSINCILVFLEECGEVLYCLQLPHGDRVM